MKNGVAKLSQLRRELKEMEIIAQNKKKNNEI
jgi:hypothetical protein